MSESAVTRVKVMKLTLFLLFVENKIRHLDADAPSLRDAEELAIAFRIVKASYDYARSEPG